MATKASPGSEFPFFKKKGDKDKGKKSASDEVRSKKLKELAGKNGK